MMAWWVMGIDDGLRRQLITLARGKRTRTHQFTPSRPTHWAPTEVLRPGGNEPFTPQSAWEYVVELLESGIEVEKILLDVPPGKAGYVMLAPCGSGETVYIKLQLGSGFVIGRSFHISNKQDAK